MAEIAMAVILLVGAGLLIKSLRQLQRVDSGMLPAGVLTLRVSPSVETYPDRDQLTRVMTRLLSRLRALPGVSFVGAKLGRESLGEAGYVATQMASILGANRVKPVPDIAVGGDGSTRLADVLIRKMLAGSFPDPSDSK